MKTSQKDLFHGSALIKVIEHESFTALNKTDDKYGHYRINSDIAILVKYATSKSSHWQFTFSQDDIGILRTDISAGLKTFICLVCGSTSSCLLKKSQFESILDFNLRRSQGLEVEIKRSGGSYWVSGKLGEYPHAIPHCAFPDDLFK